MTRSIVIASYMLMHCAIVWMVMVTSTIRADRIMIMVPIAMIPIYKWIYAIVWSPPMRIISPVVWRMPTYPRCTPKPIINQRSMNIYRFNNIVRTIDVFITYQLYRNGLGCFIFLYKDRCHILVYILCQHSLNNHQMAIAICCLYHA
jgi:hypothetical protein